METFEFLCNSLIMQLLQIEVHMSFGFELSKEEATRLLSALKTVRLKDSMALVKQKLGNPDSERANNTKTNAGVLQGHLMSYHVKCVRLDRLPDPLNQVISLYFNAERKLEQIGYQSIEPLFGEVIKGPRGMDGAIHLRKPPAQ